MQTDCSLESDREDVEHKVDHGVGQNPFIFYFLFFGVMIMCFFDDYVFFFMQRLVPGPSSDREDVEHEVNHGLGQNPFIFYFLFLGVMIMFFLMIMFFTFF